MGAGAKKKICDTSLVSQNPGRSRLWRPRPPDHAVLQASGDHVDRDALWLVGEGHRADDLPAVHVADQVAIDGPKSQVAAAAHWNTEGQSSVVSRSQTFIVKKKNHFEEEWCVTRVADSRDVPSGLTGRHCSHGALVACETLNVAKPEETQQDVKKNDNHHTDPSVMYEAVPTVTADQSQPIKVKAATMSQLNQICRGNIKKGKTSTGW